MNCPRCNHPGTFDGTPRYSYAEGTCEVDATCEACGNEWRQVFMTYKALTLREQAPAVAEAFNEGDTFALREQIEAREEAEYLDLMAAHALVVFSRQHDGVGITHDDIARQCYRAAAAMLAEKKRRKQPAGHGMVPAVRDGED